MFYSKTEAVLLGQVNVERCFVILVSTIADIDYDLIYNLFR